MEHCRQFCQNICIRSLEPTENFLLNLQDIRYYIDEVIYNSFSLDDVDITADPLAHYAICFYLKYKYVV